MRNRVKYNRTAMEVLMHLTQLDRTLEEEYKLIQNRESKLNYRQRQHVIEQMTRCTE
jgi:uncharacterized protein